MGYTEYTVWLWNCELWTSERPSFYECCNSRQCVTRSGRHQQQSLMNNSSNISWLYDSLWICCNRHRWNDTIWLFTMRHASCVFILLSISLCVSLFLSFWLSVRLDFMNLTKPGDTNVYIRLLFYHHFVSVNEYEIKPLHLISGRGIHFSKNKVIEKFHTLARPTWLMPLLSGGHFDGKTSFRYEILKSIL